MKLFALTTTAAIFALALASPVAAQTAEGGTEDGTISDTSKAATEAALGIDVTLAGSTDEERMAFFMAMSAEEQTTMREKCTTYIGLEPTRNANEIASDAAMSFCKVVVAPQ